MERGVQLMGFADFDIMGKCKKILNKIGALEDLMGESSDSGGTVSSGTLSAKLNSLLTSWTSGRAAYLDDIRSYTVTNNTASKTGVLSAKLSYLTSLLENGAYGLSAIKTSTTAFRKPTKLFKTKISSKATTGSGKGVLFISIGGNTSETTIVVDGITLVSKYNFNGSCTFFIEFSDSFSIKDEYTASFVIAVFY